MGLVLSTEKTLFWRPTLATTNATTITETQVNTEN